MRQYVALDLETSGLSPERDAIIEIGATHFENGEILKEYSSLVAFDGTLSEQITHITGIYPEDLEDARVLEVVLPEIDAFVGDLPIVAHNVSFDLRFLRKQGLFYNNQALDTFELSTILLPRMPRYTLSSLTTSLEITLENAHRALDDARACGMLYEILWQKALSLPLPLLYEISRAGGSNWASRQFFQAAFTEKQSQSDPEITPLTHQFTPLSKSVRSAKQAEEATAPLDEGTLLTMFEGDSTFANALSGYEPRPQQSQMAAHIAESFNEQTHLIIEAGTGTGKSLAYLIPSALWALQNEQRVLIATNTINLQDQLMDQDVPIVQTVVGEELKASVMKGRNNYLCPRRLAAFRRRGASTPDEAKLLAKVLVWLNESSTGDRQEITLNRGDHYIWRRVSAEDPGCTTDACVHQMQASCPFHKARRHAEAANLVIANHALLISDAVSESQVLPPYEHVVVDEAHQLEDAITNGLTTAVDQARIVRQLNLLGNIVTGALGDLVMDLRANAPSKDVLKVESFIQIIGEASPIVSQQVARFFSQLHEYLASSGILNRIDNQRSWRLLAKHRSQGEFASLIHIWEQLDEYFEVLIQSIEKLLAASGRFEQYKIATLTERLELIGSVARTLTEQRDQMNTFTLEPDENTIYWVQLAHSADELIIQTAPLHIGQLVDEYLWQKKQSVVLTSATLQTHNGFQYLKERLYAEDVEAIGLGSPFDYEASTLLYLPTDIHEPSERGYQKHVERTIIELASALDGRTLVLFTSYMQLQQTAQHITPRLALGDIAVFDQSSGSSRVALMDNFKSADKAVLLGTRSFWQGVDVPGDDLSALMIARLPFTVPSDPIFAARSETYENSFQNYAVPEAVLRFRQGFGRLIRSQTDRGIVVILDRRITSKRYGTHFIEALPSCTVHQGSMEALPQIAKDWLDIEH